MSNAVLKISNAVPKTWVITVTICNALRQIENVLLDAVITVGNAKLKVGNALLH